MLGKEEKRSRGRQSRGRTAKARKIWQKINPEERKAVLVEMKWNGIG